MLSLCQTKNQVFERVLRTKTGDFVLATFLVYEYQGRVKARLISAVPIENADTESYAIKALPAPILKTVYEKTLSFGEAILSPFSDFAFLMSQPTRAPARESF